MSPFTSGKYYKNDDAYILFDLPRSIVRMSRPPPPNFPPEEPVIPIEPDVAKARASYIRATVAKIQALHGNGSTLDTIRDATGTFSTQYPGLFKMLLSDSYNDASLRTMLSLLDKMGSGNMSQHQASVVVGQRLHDIYIKPKMSNA
jgi:hypothetical protein